MIARTKKKLSTDIDGAFFVGAHMQRSVPVEAQLSFSIIGLWFNEPGFQGDAIHAANLTALGFGVNVVGIGRVSKDPKTIAAKQIFPTAVGDAAWVLGIADPVAVVLQTSKDVIWIGVVGADVIKLRNWQVVGFPPTAAAVVGIPEAAVIAGDQVVGVFRIDPDVVEIPVRPASDGAETFSAVFAHDQGQIGLVNFVFILGIDNQIGEIKRAPYHPVAAVAFFPSFAAVIGTEEGATSGFNQSVHNIWF